MFYRNSKLTRDQIWTRSPNTEAGQIARDFLSGEKDLMELVQSRTSAVISIMQFLEASKDDELVVDTADSGNLLVRAMGREESLLITGKTAFVLASYLQDSPVCMQDRFDMTVRQRCMV